MANLAAVQFVSVVSVVALIAALRFPLNSAISEAEALLTLKGNLSDPEGVLASWDGNISPCLWFHVVCNGANHVIRLDLGNASLSGKLVEELGSLPNLQYLNLYGNGIQGSIPEHLGNLTNLLDLGLYNNKLTGCIPSSLGNLKSLHNFRLNDNQLTGPIPHELAHLSQLSLLDVSNNNLCGNPPTEGPFLNSSVFHVGKNPEIGKPCSASICHI